MEKKDKEREEATKKVLQLLEEWGSESKFIWFREIHRITDIDKGILRNILNDLRKSKDVIYTQKDTQRIFFCLKKYYKKCQDVEKRFKGKSIILKDGSKTKVFQNTTKSSERTRKRLEKQKIKRQVKAYAKVKGRAKLKNRTRPHKS
ncbi:MAG TPA: hypothetical protein VMW55_10950 [Nitrosopumilaceae archaeon]|jgi:hypothetical protein|nr:hypothetical protein [Nitrosopumilaceae archaeon]